MTLEEEGQEEDFTKERDNKRRRDHEKCFQYGDATTPSHQCYTTGNFVEPRLELTLYHNPEQLGPELDWAKWLHWAEYWHNSTFQRAAGMTPFKALYGREPPPLIRFSTESTVGAYIQDQITERNAILKELKANLTQAQASMKAQADKSRRDIEWEVGDYVYIKIQPYHMRSLAGHLNEKLRPRFFGPYCISERIGPVACRLDSPITVCIHPVFHATQLKQCPQPAPPIHHIPQCLTEDHELQAQSEAAGDYRGDIKVLVQWECLPESDNTWEIYDNIREHFPSFHLEDKVVLQAGRNVGNQKTPIVYLRKVKENDWLGGRHVDGLGHMDKEGAILEGKKLRDDDPCDGHMGSVPS